MSGFAYPPPIFNSGCNNPSFYISTAPDGVITYEYAQSLFLAKTDSRLGYITGITAGTATAGTALITDASKNIAGIGSLSAGCVLVGTSTDTSRMISCLDSTMSAGQFRSITVGKANQAGDQVELMFKYNDVNSGLNRCTLGFYAAPILTLRRDEICSLLDEGSFLGLNILKSTASPALRIGRAESANNCCSIFWKHVANGSADNGIEFDMFGTSNACVITQNGTSINGARTNVAVLEVFGSVSWAQSGSKYYNVATDVYSTAGASSIPLAIAAPSGHIFVNNGILTASDARVKHDIRDYDIDLNAYKMLNPKIYRKNNNPDKQEIGLIAQEVVSVGLTDVLAQVPNKELTKQSKYDSPDGSQWTLEYDKLTIVNMCVIQKLMDRVVALEAECASLVRRMDVNVIEY